MLDYIIPGKCLQFILLCECVCIYIYRYPVTNQLSKDANLENKINFAIFLFFFFLLFILDNIFLL